MLQKNNTGFWQLMHHNLAEGKTKKEKNNLIPEKH